MAFNSMNNWTGVGRLTHDPELKTTSSGVSVIGFTLAIDRSYADKEGNRQTDFIPCTAFRSTADFIAKWAHKGDVLGVTGALQSRKYDDKDGNKRTAYEVVVNEVSICNGRKADSASATDTGSETEMAAAEDEDMPF